MKYILCIMTTLDNSILIQIEMLKGKIKLNTEIIEELKPKVKNHFYRVSYDKIILKEYMHNFIFHKIHCSDNNGRTRYCPSGLSSDFSNLTREYIELKEYMEYKIYFDTDKKKHVYKYSAPKKERSIAVSEIKISPDSDNIFGLCTDFLDLSSGSIKTFAGLLFLNDFINKTFCIIRLINNMTYYTEWIDKYCTISDEITLRLGKIQENFIEEQKIENAMNETIKKLDISKN